MALENIYQITVNTKKKMFRDIPEIIANDNAVFEITIYDDAVLFPFVTGYTAKFVSLKLSGKSVIRDATIADGVVRVVLGSSEMLEPGKVEGTVQIFDANLKRISTAKFDYVVKKDPSLQGGLPTDDKTLVMANESLFLETIEKGDNLQAQLDVLVVEGDSSVAANQARVDAKGVTKGSLKTRLDDDYNELSSNLADIAPQLKSMGAVLDGVTDDAPIINTYINQLSTSGKVRTVLLPDTTIAISTITINTPNVILKGNRNTVLKKKLSSPTTQDFINVQADGVTIENIQFDDNGISSGYLVNANYNQITVKKDIKIKDLRFTAKHQNSRGIIVGYYDGVEISGCKLENTIGSPDTYSFGIAVWSQKDLGDNTIQTKNIQIHHNKIKGFYQGINSWGTGEGVSGNRQRMYIESNIIEKCSRYGIFAYHSPRSIIANNFIRNCTDGGIWSDSGGDYEYDYSDATLGIGNRVIGNYIQNCAVGILTEEFRYGLVSNNTIFQCSSYGIGIGGGTDSSSFNNNTLYQNGYGIYIDKYINPNNYYIFDIELRGNIIKGNKYHGIRAGGVRKVLKISGGFITDNGTDNVGVTTPAINYAGIWIGKDNVNSDGTTCKDIIISDVMITNGYQYENGLTPVGQQDYGVYVQQSSINRLTIRGCDFAGHATNPIYARFVTQGLTIKDTCFLTTTQGNNLTGSVLYTSGNTGLQTDYTNNNSGFNLGGTWNGEHLILNGNHFWVDSGNLYTKSSAPTSATDGSILKTAVLFIGNGRLATDPITSYTSGVIERAEIGGSNSTITSFPNSSAGTLVTCRGLNDLYSYQEYHLRQGLSVYKRYWDTTNSVWTTWTKISAV